MRMTSASVGSDVATWTHDRLTRYLDRWITTMTRPHRVWATFVTPRDQAAGIGFALGTVLLWFVLGLASGVISVPVYGNLYWLSVFVWGAFLLAVVTPVALHVLAAGMTIALMVLAPERGHISETVQVLALSLAPAVGLIVPNPLVQIVCGVYGIGLLCYGLATVHELSFWRAIFIGFLPGYLVFFIGFGAETALFEMLRHWYII